MCSDPEQPAEAGSEQPSKSGSGQPSKSGSGQPSKSGSGQPSIEALLATLRSGLSHHRPYLVLSGGLLACSILFGLLFVDQNTDLSRIPVSRLGSITVAQESNLFSMLAASTELFSVLVVGAATLGLLTAAGLIAQGLVAGYFLGLSLGQPPAFLFVSFVPHGLGLFAGFALGAAVSFRLVAAAIARLAGRRETLYTDQEWREAGVVLFAGWLCLLASALIEAFLTFRLSGLLS